MLPKEECRSQSKTNNRGPQQKLHCTQEEFKQFALIHGRLKDLMKLLRERSVENQDKIAYKQTELDEDITEFWHTIENMGQSVGIDISGKLDMIKEIIFDKEIQTSLSGIGNLFSTGAYIDGKYVDEIELAEMMKEEYEQAAKPRQDLIQDLDRIMVRLTKCFGANKEIKLQQPSPEKVAKTEQITAPTKHQKIWTLIKRIPRWIYGLVAFSAALLAILEKLGCLDLIKVFVTKILWPK